MIRRADVHLEKGVVIGISADIVEVCAANELSFARRGDEQAHHYACRQLGYTSAC